MSQLNCIMDLSNYILSALKSGCTDVDFVSSYPNELTEFPVARPTVSVGITRADLPFTECAFKGLDTGDGAYYGTNSKCTYSLKICVPKTMAGEECYKTFDKVANVCINMNDICVTNIFCAGISYNRIMGALVLEAGIELNADIISVVHTGVFIQPDGTEQSQ